MRGSLFRGSAAFVFIGQTFIKCLNQVPGKHRVPSLAGVLWRCWSREQIRTLTCVFPDSYHYGVNGQPGRALSSHWGRVPKNQT